MANQSMTISRPAPAFSLVSILAILAGIGSFATGPMLGMLLAIAAILLGAIGVVIALLPSVRGGIISVVSILLGVLGIIAAIFRFIL